MAPATLLSKTERANIVSSHKEKLDEVASSISLSAPKPDVFVYHTEEDRLEVLETQAVEYRSYSQREGFSASLTEYEYPVSRYFLEEEIEKCSAANSMIKALRKNKRTSSILMVEAYGIIAGIILVDMKRPNTDKKKKANKGFA